MASISNIFVQKTTIKTMKRKKWNVQYKNENSSDNNSATLQQMKNLLREDSFPRWCDAVLFAA